MFSWKRKRAAHAHDELFTAQHTGPVVQHSDLHAGEMPAENIAACPRRKVVRPAIMAIGLFARSLILAPLVLFRGRRRAESVIVYSVHPAFYLWLPIVVGMGCAAAVRANPAWAGMTAWLAIWIALFFVAALLYDVSVRKLALWVGIVMLVWLASKYIEHVRQVAIVGYLVDYLTGLNPQLDPGTSAVMCWLLVLPWLGSVCDMALNRRKRFTPNEIGEYHFGEGRELTDRTGLRFRTQYRDVLETILTFGGGDLIAVDNHQHVIKRWDNIIGLYFVWNDLDRILHQRAVTDEAPEEEKPVAA